jgi:hypothetical protein
MKILSCFKHLIPVIHAYQNDEQRYNIGATWTATDGLQDYHNLELKYVHNSERLALQGDPQPDGSWKYVQADGRVHVITAERAAAFMKTTSDHANIMCQMLDRLQKMNNAGPTVDTSVSLA